jgi:hypothetical protein
MVVNAVLLRARLRGNGCPRHLHPMGDLRSCRHCTPSTAPLANVFWGSGTHLDWIILTDADYAEFPFSDTAFP